MIWNRVIGEDFERLADTYSEDNWTECFNFWLNPQDNEWYVTVRKNVEFGYREEIWHVIDFDPLSIQGSIK